MRHALTALAIACAFAPAAFAQTPADAADGVILRVESGSVMVSQQGAEFVTVESDVTLQPEDRVLVPEGSAASLDYGQGCNVSLVTGAYPVAASCPLRAPAQAAAAEAPAAPVASSAAAAGTGVSSTALIVGGVAAAAAIAIGSSGSSSSPPPPVSR